MMHWEEAVDMKDDRILEAEVRAALDDCLSGVDDMPSLRYDIM
jgi:hypothetical protein